MMNIQNYSDSIERSILSCFILKPKLLLTTVLGEKHFIKNKNVFTFFKQSYDKYKNLDLQLMIANILTKKDRDKFIELYTDLALFEASTESFEQYEQMQLDLYKEQNIIQLTEKLQLKQINVQDFIQSINDLNKDILSAANDLIDEEKIYNLLKNNNSILKFETLKKLGNAASFQKNTFNVIAARPSVGKSAFALNMLMDLSKNYKCIYFNMEMTEKEIYQRMVAIMTGIPIKSFTNMSDLQDKTVRKSLSILANKKIKIIHGTKSLDSIKSILIREQMKEHLIVFIDYVGYIQNGKYQNDRERVGTIVRSLQCLTKDYDITIFCLAQINRDGDEEPTLINLKDTGELEQTAAIAILIHNESNNPKSDLVPRMKIIIPKNRASQTGVFHMNFIKEKQIFVEEKEEWK